MGLETPSHRPSLPYRSSRKESFPLQPLSRKDTTSTIATSSTTSSTWTSSSTDTFSSFPGNNLATSTLHKLRHTSTPKSSRRPRSWHQETPSSRQRTELENKLDQKHRKIHQQNLYTDCGRHSNEWLFSGWGELAKWALGSGSGEATSKARERDDEGRRNFGDDEEERGRSVRKAD